jgi:hypothetical protein
MSMQARLLASIGKAVARQINCQNGHDDHDAMSSKNENRARMLTTRVLKLRRWLAAYDMRQRYMFREARLS